MDKDDLKEDYGKNKYKLHYIYREFTMDFFSMDLTTLPKNASSLKFSKHTAHVMSLCLTLHVNLGLSLHKTSQALKDLYNINISHQQIAKVLNEVEMLQGADNMPGKWQLLIFLGQQTILNMQKTGAAASERSCCQ